ncbi:MAG: YIP1 family protein [Vicinamibacteria bacterium]
MSQHESARVESASDRSERMYFGSYFQKAVQILQLDEKTIEEVAHDEEALLPALLFFAIAGLANGAGQFSFRGMIFGPVVATLLSFVVVGLLSVLSRLFGGDAVFLDLYRPLGVAAPIFWVQAVPLLGPFFVCLALVYFAVVAVVVVEKTARIPRGKAVAIVALLAAISLFLVLVFLAMVGSMLLFRALFS